jgi:hypothetical protein
MVGEPFHYSRRASTVCGSGTVACRTLHLVKPGGGRRGIRAHLATGSSRLAALVALAALALAVAAPARASAPVGFSFHASNITGISTGSAFLTGGGTFDPAGATVHAGGGFRCTNAIAGAPFAGCLAGQGVRWDTSEVLPSTLFKCTAAETPRAISTDAQTVVLAADFYRAGDGNDESFNAQMIVSASDLDAAIPGDQHVWIQGIGCGLAGAGFGR